MNIREFYEQDPRRRESDEIGFGEGWTVHDDPSATYQVRWVERTGELYAVREPHPGGGLLSRFFDYFNVHQADVDELTVQILAVADRPAIEEALAGWPVVMGERDSLRWARRRTAALPAPADAGDRLDAGTATGVGDPAGTGDTASAGGPARAEETAPASPPAAAHRAG